MIKQKSHLNSATHRNLGAHNKRRVPVPRRGSVSTTATTTGNQFPDVTAPQSIHRRPIYSVLPCIARLPGRFPGIAFWGSGPSDGTHGAGDRRYMAPHTTSLPGRVPKNDWPISLTVRQAPRMGQKPPEPSLASDIPLHHLQVPQGSQSKPGTLASSLFSAYQVVLDVVLLAAARPSSSTRTPSPARVNIQFGDDIFWWYQMNWTEQFDETLTRCVTVPPLLPTRCHHHRCLL